MVWFTLGFWAGTATPGITLDIRVGLSDDYLDFRAEVDCGPGRTAGARGVRGRPANRLPRRASRPPRSTTAGPIALSCQLALSGMMRQLVNIRNWPRDTHHGLGSGPGSQVGSQPLWIAVDGYGHPWTRKPSVQGCVDGCGHRLEIYGSDGWGFESLRACCRSLCTARPIA